MNDGDHRPDEVGPAPGRHYTSRSSAKRREKRSTRRVVFFALASIWGFVVGVVGLLAATGAEGQALASSANVLPALIPSFLVAGAGSFVMAAAYRESKRRDR